MEILNIYFPPPVLKDPTPNYLQLLYKSLTLRDNRQTLLIELRV